MGLPPFKVEVAVPWEVEEWSWPLPWWGVKVLEEIISTRQDTLAILNTRGLGPKNVNIERGACRMRHLPWACRVQLES